jgi:hypothetical protein
MSRQYPNADWLDERSSIGGSIDLPYNLWITVDISAAPDSFEVHSSSPIPYLAVTFF